MDSLTRFLNEFRPSGHTTYVAIELDGDTSCQTFNGTDPDAALSWIKEQNANGSGVYYTANPTRAGQRKKPTKADILAIGAVWADLDPRGDLPWEQEQERFAALADELKALDIPPTFIVGSGNGLQPVWLLDDPIEATPESQDLAEGFCRRIERSLGASGTHNIDRLLRVPDTINYPNRHKRELGRGEVNASLRHASWQRYSLAELEGLADELERRPPEHAIPSVGTTKASLEPDERLDDIPKVARGLRRRFDAALRDDLTLRAVWEGEPPSGADQTRSAFDLKLAGAMRHGGFSLEDFAALAFEWEHGKRIDGGARHWERTWAKAGERSDFELAAERLAQLPPDEYDRARKAEASKLGVRVGTLDAEVAPQRPEPETAGAGHRLEWPEVVPWVESVEGAALADALCEHLQRFAVMSSEHATSAMALFALHCHAIDAATHSPRLLISSPTYECGKSQLIGWLADIVPRPFQIIDPTGPTLFRPIELYQPTVLVDEADQVSWDDRKDLLSVIHSGHSRFGPGVPRCVGDDNEVVVFRVWAPLALAMIGKPKAVMLSRSIVVRMERKAPTETVEHRRVDRDQGFGRLRRQCARWVADNLGELRGADPELPLNGRRADCWRPLIAIADQLGDDWPKRARAAALALSGIETEDQAYGLQLLADIKQIFDHRLRGQKSVWTETLLEKLCLLPEQPWTEYGRNHQPITSRQLASLLRPFEIKSRQVMREGRNKQGYHRRQFLKVWKRYVDNDDPSSS
jgi:hypothetical protein